MTWPDAVKLVIAYLGPRNTVPVVSRVPNQRPAELIQVRRVGGTPMTVRDVARLDVFAWAETDARAWELARTQRAHIWTLAGTTLLGPTVYSVSEFMGPRQDDDPVSSTPRVWATYELSIRADSAIQPAASIVDGEGS